MPPRRHVFVPFRSLPYRRNLRVALTNYSKAYCVKVTGSPVLRKEVQGTLDKLTVLENNAVVIYVTDHLKSQYVYSRPMIKNDYDGMDFFTETKYDINLQFLALLQRYALVTDHVMVLDTHFGHTVRLLSTMFPANHIHVPNPANEINVDLCDAAQWHDMTALEFLRDWPVNQPTHYWLDYCCTFWGCETQTLPKLDLEVLLVRGDLPRTDGVLAMTFSLRGSSAALMCEKIERFVCARAAANRYRIKLKAKPLVYGRMVFLCFVTGK